MHRCAAGTAAVPLPETARATLHVAGVDGSSGQVRLFLFVPFSRPAAVWLSEKMTIWNHFFYSYASMS